MYVRMRAPSPKRESVANPRSLRSSKSRRVCYVKRTVEDKGKGQSYLEEHTPWVKRL